MSITFFCSIHTNKNQKIYKKTSIRNHQIKHTWSIKVVLSLGFTICSPHHNISQLAPLTSDRSRGASRAGKPTSTSSQLSLRDRDAPCIGWRPKWRTPAIPMWVGKTPLKPLGRCWWVEIGRLVDMAEHVQFVEWESCMSMYMNGAFLPLLRWIYRGIVSQWKILHL